MLYICSPYEYFVRKNRGYSDNNNVWQAVCNGQWCPPPCPPGSQPTRPVRTGSKDIRSVDAICSPCCLFTSTPISVDGRCWSNRASVGVDQHWGGGYIWGGRWDMDEVGLEKRVVLG